MTINETIKTERWEQVSCLCEDVILTDHNASIDRIKAAYQKEYDEWQDGDERLRRMHEEHLAEYAKRITELEAQVPIVVKPVRMRLSHQYDAKCECGTGAYYGTKYCYNCGAKLDWVG